MDYLKIYEDLISSANNKCRIKSSAEYYENHHIYPTSWCRDNELEYLIYDDRNKVLLSGKEHYLAHHLLTKIYPEDSSMIHAFWGMTNKNKNKHNVTPRQYESAKKLQAKYMSNRIISVETRSKIGKYMKGRYPGTKNPNYGNKWTDEQKKKMSDYRKKLVLKYYYTSGSAITPWGIFRSIHEAINKSPFKITYNTLNKYCKESNNIVKKSNLQNSNLLTELDIGKSFDELGFGFVPLNTSGKK